ncbi:MAG: peptidoglycan DD-metalloendopeptidase family protein, partial [Tunicatimonas sp.]|uniref:M23 family metallopeptidase n=1 Tax=Tunicatimonas sp. TaxID=1940096 RepID=UPI003C75B2C6
SELVESEPHFLYGIEVDSFKVVEATVKPNQFLSQILLNHNVSYGIIDRLAKQSRQVFDVRKIRENRDYTLLCSQDSAVTAQYFIYEPSNLEYVVFDLTDSVNIYKGQHEIDTLTKEFAGIIDYSIYQTLQDNGAKPELAATLAELYAWQLDLFKVQKGDRFKLIYEEIQIRGQAVGVGKILAAHFERTEEDYYAFYYDQQGKEEYFDEKGNSLRKAFLKAPLRYSRISSRFSHSRLHPVLKIRRPHYGIDYAAPTGTPVRAVGDGVVTKAHYSGGAGNFVKIKHNGTYTTGYMHLSKYAEGVRRGKKVEQGDIIGYVGSTGISTGPHLDYRIWKNGKPVDALSLEMPSSEPIREELQEDYKVYMSELLDQLNQLSYPKRQFILANAKNNVQVVDLGDQSL